MLVSEASTDAFQANGVLGDVCALRLCVQRLLTGGEALPPGCPTVNDICELMGNNRLDTGRSLLARSQQLAAAGGVAVLGRAVRLPPPPLPPPPCPPPGIASSSVGPIALRTRSRSFTATSLPCPCRTSSLRDRLHAAEAAPGAYIYDCWGAIVVRRVSTCIVFHSAQRRAVLLRLVSRGANCCTIVVEVAAVLGIVTCACGVCHIMTLNFCVCACQNTMFVAVAG